MFVYLASDVSLLWENGSILLTYLFTAVSFLSTNKCDPFETGLPFITTP